MKAPQPDCKIQWDTHEFTTIRVHLHDDLKGRQEELCAKVGSLAADNRDVPSLTAALAAFASGAGVSVNVESEPDHTPGSWAWVSVAFRPADNSFEMMEETSRAMIEGAEAEARRERLGCGPPSRAADTDPPGNPASLGPASDWGPMVNAVGRLRGGWLPA